MELGSSLAPKAYSHKEMAGNGLALGQMSLSIFVVHTFFVAACRHLYFSGEEGEAARGWFSLSRCI